MDVESLAQGLNLFGATVTAIKQAIDLIPDPSKRADAELALERAARELKIAEATAANELGYQVCRNHFPPEIMISQDDQNWSCPVCGSKKNTGFDFDALKSVLESD